MTRSELTRKLTENHRHLTQADIEVIVKSILEHMAECLASGDRIEIRGGGAFSLNRRAARIGRNPKTGEKVHVPEKAVPHFKTGKDLRERVDRDNK